MLLRFVSCCVFVFLSLFLVVVLLPEVDTMLWVVLVYFQLFVVRELCVGQLVCNTELLLVFLVVVVVVVVVVCSCCCCFFWFLVVSCGFLLFRLVFVVGAGGGGGVVIS